MNFYLEVVDRGVIEFGLLCEDEGKMFPHEFDSLEDSAHDDGGEFIGKGVDAEIDFGLVDGLIVVERLLGGLGLAAVGGVILFILSLWLLELGSAKGRVG